MSLKKSRVPLSLIQTRDCFAFDLYVKETVMDFETQLGCEKRKRVMKREYFFMPDNLPENYDQFMPEATKVILKSRQKNKKNNPTLYPVGITSYENFFSHEELQEIENLVEETEKKCENRAFLPMTAQQTFSK